VPADSTSAAPIPAMPLDYAGDSTDPLLPALQIITRVLLYLGICRLVGTFCYAVYLSSLKYSVNFWHGWISLSSGVVGIVQIVACAKYIRRPGNILWIWIWIWVDLLNAVAGNTIATYIVISPPPGQLPESRIQVAAIVADRILSIPVGCSLALVMMILLISRKRLGAASAK
jgi:hypothetical protein